MEVGVTIYATVPAVVELGLFSVCAMVGPDPAVAPVIPPLIVPMVQLKVLAAVAVSAMLVAVPLQIAAVLVVVTAGIGFTVTVILYGVPAQPGVVVDVGVTTYCTEPGVALLGLVSTWLIVGPLPAEAPVMPPLIVPRVQAKVLGVVAVRETLGFVPLHVLAVAAVVTTGLGLTVTVSVNGVPVQPDGELGVIIYWTVPAVELLGLVSTWLMVPPDPALAPVIPPVTVPIVQLKLAGASAVSVIFGLVPVQMLEFGEFVTVGVVSAVTTLFEVTGKHPVASATETV